MRHRALRLLGPLVACKASSSFTRMLQEAARSAWARSVSSHSTLPPATARDEHHPKPAQNSPPHSLTTSDFAVLRKALSKHRTNPRRPSEPQNPPQSCSSSAVRKVKKPRSKLNNTALLVAPFDEACLQDSDAWHSLYRTSAYDTPLLERPWYWDDDLVGGTPVSRQTFRRRTSSFPLAKTKFALYQNLLRLLHYHDRTLRFPELLDYHDLHPGLRSTRSYNLLISLGLRNGAYGSVKWLFSSMHAERIPTNLESWKLRVRWLVQSGWWERAWRESMNVARNMPSPNADEPLPLSIWLEFFRTPKQGTTRLNMRNSEAMIAKELNSVELSSERHHALMKIRPTLTLDTLSQTHPNLIYYLVRIMLNQQKHAQALSFTKTYFTNISRHLPTSRSRACLDIIHLFIHMGSTQRGLARLYETRRVMVSLLKLHPAFRPTSSTLFLLLGPLQKAKRCGTVAWSVVHAFEKEWGRQTIDRRVRRRVIRLALKEGRKDIAHIMLHSERRSRRTYERWQMIERLVGRSFVLRPVNLLRPPARELFRYVGRESRYWRRLIKRLSTRYKKRK